MSSEPTIRQSDDDRRRAQQLSLQRTRPPLVVDGYEPVRFLGQGAYGEVWVSIDQNTGRHVAIKYYTHRGGLDWSLLSREVEKLRFLFADRYVVQLLDVGWEADPPYYVMEYLEQGSLAERLQDAGSLPVDEAVKLFRDIAIGLQHAHDKGVLHCDLKPANVLLDADFKPRLADFGQARLSDEQVPALGTLFYMAPEQADLAAVPEAGWDVYALGALFYCMLVGSPPRRSDEALAEIEQAGDLPQRLAAYRRVIKQAPAPTAHRQAEGVDRALAEIIERCLEVDPKRRFPNVQAVLDSLESRAMRRARRPLLLLGAVGPLLLVLVIGLFARTAFNAAVRQSREALLNRALTTNEFAVRSVAKAVAYDIDQRFQAVSNVAADARVESLLTAVQDDPDVERTIAELQVVDISQEQSARALMENPRVGELQTRLETLAAELKVPRTASWFVTNRQGVQLARVPEALNTIGKNFAWRSYFNGDQVDRPEGQAVPPNEHVTGPHLSDVIRSQATNQYVVVVSTAVFSGGKFLGVVGLSVAVGDFVMFNDNDQQFWALVDARDGDYEGVIVQHRLFKQFEKIPSVFVDPDYRVPHDQLPAAEGEAEVVLHENYQDPLGTHPEASGFGGSWLAAMARVRVRNTDTQYVAVVQEKQATATAPVGELAGSLQNIAVAAVGVVVAVVLGLWGLVAVVVSDSPRGSLGRLLRRRAGLASDTGANSTRNGSTRGNTTRRNSARGESGDSAGRNPPEDAIGETQDWRESDR